MSNPEPQKTGAGTSSGSRRDRETGARRVKSKYLYFGTCLLMTVSFGCWEQIDGGMWFPQMKRQITVQAFEIVEHNDQRQGFSPPEGTVPVSWATVPDVASMSIADQEALENPVPASLASLKRGEILFDRYCSTCHGPEGHGDGPLAGPPFGSRGPLGMVLPVGGPTSMAKVLTDGHIYTTISLGRGRMPNYSRISPDERWDVINFIRDLNGQGGRQ